MLDWFPKREEGKEGEVLKDNNVFVCICEGENRGRRKREKRKRRPLLLL